MAGQPVALDSLSPQELVEVSKQLETEINGLVQHAVALQQTAGKFAAAGQAVEFLQDQKQGQPLLLPLTDSLYVSGTLESVDTVLLEVGTGYFVELIKSRQTALAQVNAVLDRHVAAQSPSATARA
ncbi:hypothetical protein QBZ16_004021 [Prototheca wickerhamii]|uniref:Prefoldin subunit 5 n=1 Tax=Prototheca wickerhamii TaxID=3111 RepID=A0AAD9MLH3_PROWI|nr:hypothetical protein QBZ16_004021 [Prototheca wickerhamii]